MGDGGNTGRESEHRLIISHEDLAGTHHEPVGAGRHIDLTAESWDEPPRVDGRVYPAVADYGRSDMDAPKGALGKVSEVLQLSALHTAALGAGGGFVAWLVTELLVNERQNLSLLEVVLEMAVFFSFVGAFIGAPLAAGDALYARNYRRAGIAALYGAAAGFAGGFLGGAFGQLLYSLTGEIRSASFAGQIFSRTLGWAALGLFVGVGGGVASELSDKRPASWWPPPPAWRAKAVNGLIGGVIGGALGGLLFDVVGELTGGGAVSRALAFSGVGAAAGAGVGVVASLRKEAWLQAVTGPMKGKQFILYEGESTLGTSYKCSIVLIPAPGLAPVHAVIDWDGRRAVVQNVGAAGGTFVDGRPVDAMTLTSGSEIRIGDNVFRFSARDSA